MLQNKNILTKEGKKKLEDELKLLVGDVRDKAIEELAEARAQGDLSENAEYDAARDKQAEIEGRIKEIEAILQNSQIVKTSTKNATVVIGSTVVIKKGASEKTLKIVGTLEANPFENRISNESPVAKAILGHKKGETVIVEAAKKYKLLIADIK